MAFAKKVKKGKFTYAEYLTWGDDERWEIIDGTVYSMTPAPNTKHQRIVLIFSQILNIKLKGKKCVPFIAPTDVVLSENDVVQPDVFVVCDKSKIKDVIQGAPDLVIEVLSPSTALKDKREKKALYEKYAVKEYIIVDPLENYAERFVLDENGSFGKSDIFAHTEILPLVSLKELEIPLSEVFEIEEVAETPEGE
jgi:Uma2 family endonuclease